MRDRIRRAFDAIHAEEQLKTDIIIDERSRAGSLRERRTAH